MKSSEEESKPTQILTLELLDKMRREQDAGTRRQGGRQFWTKK